MYVASGGLKLAVEVAFLGFFLSSLSSVEEIGQGGLSLAAVVVVGVLARTVASVCSLR